ncbi:hypothetical protein [Lactococcus lactis]|uniref:hypothetical protein n=1 Tax=Lactococcus lactis TaxID=1358 RepID=UPI0022E391DC|nr:hypothetical protein [Lactococcus lactis]
MDYHDILRETGIVLIWAPELHDKGFYVPYAEECKSENGIVFVRLGLSEDETECVILHECGHKIKGRTLSKLSPPQLHIINESKANRYMIHCKAEEWLNYMDDEDREYISIERFLNWCELNVREFYDMAEQEIYRIIHAA